MSSEAHYDPNRGYWFDQNGQPHPFIVASARAQSVTSPADATSSSRSFQARSMALPAPPSTVGSRLRPSPPILQDERSSDDDISILQSPPSREMNVYAKGKRRAAEPEQGTSGNKKKAKVSSHSGRSRASAVTKSGTAGKQGGRSRGSSNYTDEDLAALLKYVRLVLPIGQDAWQKVTAKFNKWALKHGRPKREMKPLKAKYDNIIRIGSDKPTGATEVPWYIEEALMIETLVNEKSHTQEFNDSDCSNGGDNGGGEGGSVDEGDANEAGLHANESSGSSESDVDPAPRSASRQRITRVTPSGSTPPTLRALRSDSGAGTIRATRRNQTHQFLSSISASLDPSARDARDEARFARRLAQDEIHRLAEDNRALRERCDILQDRNTELMQQLQEKKSEISRLLARIKTFEMLRGFMGFPMTQYSHPPTRHSGPAGPWPPSALSHQHAMAEPWEQVQHEPYRPRSRNFPPSYPGCPSTSAAPQPSASGLDTLATLASSSTDHGTQHATTPDSTYVSVSITPRRNRHNRQ
ncbi:hypothetical protein BD414DRAFT_536503 [Trametes punicea]|nr:hypothetical protein BD414DRAFT_536503 [Trametes punicea]